MMKTATAEKSNSTLSPLQKVTNQPLLRLHEVIEVTRRSRSAIFRDVKEGTFPQPVRIGRRAIAWRTADILDWINNLPSN